MYITLDLLHEIFFAAHQFNRDEKTLKWHVWKPAIDRLAGEYVSKPSENIGYFTFDNHLSITHMFGIFAVIYPRESRGELLGFDLMLEDTDVGDYLIWDSDKQSVSFHYPNFASGRN